MTMTLSQAKLEPVYMDIDSRLRGLNPPFELSTWVKRVIKVHGNTLDGFDFEPTDYNKLLDCLGKLTDDYGDPAFVSDKIKDPLTGKVVVHEPLEASMARTEGAGLRQVYRIRLSDRPLVESDPRAGLSMDKRFAGLFGSDVTQLQLYSIHWDVRGVKTNVHVDETLFTMEVGGVGVFLTPDFVQHIVNDLFIKTDLAGRGGILGKIANRTSLRVPSSAVDFALRLGISVDLYRGKNVKVQATHTCSLHTDKVCYWGGEWTGSVSVSGKHDIGSGDTDRPRPKR